MSSKIVRILLIEQFEVHLKRHFRNRQHIHEHTLRSNVANIMTRRMSSVAMKRIIRTYLKVIIKTEDTKTSPNSLC